MNHPTLENAAATLHTLMLHYLAHLTKEEQAREQQRIVHQMEELQQKHKYRQLREYQACYPWIWAELNYRQRTQGKSYLIIIRKAS